jgi:CRISPR-associated endonuclease/helicase Cas3
MDDLLLAFWGKAHPSIDTGPAWHPCVYHCLDVAAVGEALLAIRPTLLADVARDLARAEDETQRTLLFLLALHDIGKLSRPFQALAPACWTMDRLELEARPPPPLPRHGEAGLDLLDGPCHERLAPIFPDWCRDEIALLLAPFLGHHGRPVACGEINTGGARAGRGGIWRGRRGWYPRAAPAQLQ